MKEYHKINSIFKRDLKTGKFTSEYSTDEFEYLKDNEWVWTEKIDGTNIRIMWDGVVTTIGGKTDNASIPSPLIAKLGTYSFDDQFREHFKDTTLCLYGEGFGPKIQNGGKYIHEQDFILFDVKIGEWWLKREDVQDVADKLNLFCVPIVGKGTLKMAEEYVKTNPWSLCSIEDNKSEGIVARPTVELKSRNGQRIITKLKCKDFE